MTTYIAHPPQEPRTRCTLYVQVGSLFLCMVTNECFFLLQLNGASTEDEIDQVFDGPGNLSILNNSKWGHTKAITVENKAALLQHLILEEVIVRWEDNLKAFILGLELLGLRSVIKIYPTLMKPLFMHQDQASLTADRFRMLIVLIGSVRPGSDDDRSKAFDFFSTTQLIILKVYS